MMAETLLRRIGMVHPIIQAPMAGGGDTPALVAAVSAAGGLGSIGAAYLSPEQIMAATGQVRANTDRPFGINLFAPLDPSALPPPWPDAVSQVAPFHALLNLPAPLAPMPASAIFDAQLDAAMECGAKVISITFGLFPAGAVDRIKARGLMALGTATTVAEARALEATGVDGIVAQGAEAGGHRGSFATIIGQETDFPASMIGTMALVPQIVDAVRIPVVASGGIMDGRGIAAALALGAAAAQMGTAFLTCAESGVPEAYRQAILASRETQTRVTRAFSGRPARGIINAFMAALDQTPDAILPFPLQNALTRPMRTEAARQGRAEMLSLWAGQGLTMARRQHVADLIERLLREKTAALAALR